MKRYSVTVAIDVMTLLDADNEKEALDRVFEFLSDRFPAGRDFNGIEIAGDGFRLIDRNDGNTIFQMAPLDGPRVEEEVDYDAELAEAAEAFVAQLGEALDPADPDVCSEFIGVLEDSGFNLDVLDYGDDDDCPVCEALSEAYFATQAE